MGASLLMSKIINFNDAKQKQVHRDKSDMHSGSEEKRRHTRVASSDRLFAQIVTCEIRPSMVGTTISCNAIDVSPDGLGIRSHEYIPEGSQLDLWVDISSRPGKIFLTSDVRWIAEKSDSQHAYRLGLALHDGAATDIEEWRKIHK